MNYINTSTEGSVFLFLNLKIDSTLAVNSQIQWSMKKDGNDEDSFTFMTNSSNYSIEAFNSYSQRLSMNLYAEGQELENNCFYSIKAVLNDVTIYRGKVYATDVDAGNVSLHNETKYVQNNTNNEYIIL